MPVRSCAAGARSGTPSPAASPTRSGTLSSPPSSPVDLKRYRVFVSIVLPQALRVIFPALSSQITIILLESAVVSQIAVTDLTYEADVLQARTAPLRRPRSGPRRGAAQSLHDDDRTRQPRHHRRLGPKAAERGSAARSAGNRRRPLRSGLPADHQPGPPCPPGTTSSGIRPSATPSWTASFTPPTALS